MCSERPHTAESSSRCQAGVESRRWPQMLGPSRSVLIRAALDLAACDRGEVSCGLSVGPLWTFTYHPVAGIDVTPSTVEVTFADPVALATTFSTSGWITAELDEQFPAVDTGRLA